MTNKDRIFETRKPAEQENMSIASRKLKKDDPFEFATTRKRQLDAALLHGDSDQIIAVAEDVAGVIRVENANKWVKKSARRLLESIFEMGNQVEEQINQADQG